MKHLLDTFILFLITLLLFSCISDSKQNNYYEISKTSHNDIDGYVGDAACIDCHQTEVDLWKGSHHDLAMQIADESTILGDFNNVETTIDGVSYYFFKRGEDYFVNVKEIDNSEKEYKISYAFGVTPLQQYLVDFDKGSKQVLRVTWDDIKKKWYHQYKGDSIEPHDWLHWTNGAQNWNTMCAECHSTNLKKNYNIETDSFQTTYSSINVNCESCHGPAEKHIEWANLEDGNDKDTYQLKGITQKEQINQCAPCHARRVKLTQNLIPGENFEDQYMVQNLTANYYHGDGQIDGEDYVLGSFMQSKMYDQGIKCTDCHNAHSLKLKLEGNKLCLQCHIPATYDSEKHHFHKENTEASQCINCHMTGKNYMGDDFRRDHSFRVPRPDQSVVYDTPNACNGCHNDKSNQWAADAIVSWYGTQRADHFSDVLLLSSQSNLTSNQRSQLDLFINDLKYPEIARATVIENLQYTTNEQFKALLLALNDSSAIVRYNTLMKLRYIPEQDRMKIALSYMKDSIKLVRIGAAQLAIGFDENRLEFTEKATFLKAKNELETMLFSNADFSTGRLQLGDYYMQINDLNNAIKNYNMALQKDSLLIPVYSNLATAYSMIGGNLEAKKTLETWMRLDALSSRPYYLRALLNFELKQDAAAIKDLLKAISLNPNNTRAMYNLATYYYQNKKDLKKAENYINKALKLETNNPEYQYLLALIYQEQGKIEKSQLIIQKLQSNQGG